MMIESFRFYSPLALLLTLPALLALWRANHPLIRPAAIFSSVADLKALPVTLAQNIRCTLPWLYGAGVLLLIGALARPQAGKTSSKSSTDGIGIEMVVDCSGSMQTPDFDWDGQPLSRIEAVKRVFGQFVVGSSENGLPGRPNDLVGCVAFGGFAESRCPLTIDHDALMEILKVSVNIPEAVRDASGRVINGEELMTAIGDGVSLGVDRLRQSKAKSRVLILLTDGGNNAGVVDPREAAKIAKNMGVKIYTIGIGSHEGAGPGGDDDFDEELLRDMAAGGGGRYFNATNTDALKTIYGEIDKLERTKVEELKFTEYNELYPWLALPGLALIFAVCCLNATRFRSLP